jgi:crotonobetainyl-CoA:carnitine CoA-transferase CaiB-like acyl-CoA transferase
MAGVLSGVKVLDLGHFVAGPFTSALLGDLGATVIKVESLGGDRLRSAKSASFAASNRGKQSVAIDLKNPAGKKAFERGCAWADVIHHNFRPSAAERLGIDGATLRQKWPHLVVLETSAYGSKGPDSHRGGFDIILQALTGHLSYLGGKSGVPIADRVLQVDYGSGMIASLAISAALLRRRRSGQGASIEIALIDTAAFLMSEVVRQGSGDIIGSHPVNSSLTGRGPCERIYRTADGWLAVVALDEQSATAFVTALDLQPFGQPSAEWGDLEQKLIEDAIGHRDTEDLTAALRSAGVWCEPCPPDARGQLRQDPVLLNRGAVVVDQDPVYGTKLDLGLGTSPDGDFDARGRGHLDELGEHTRSVLDEWGLTSEEIDSLYADGVVK